MKISLTIKNICGVKRYYPRCEISKVFCEMKKTPTLLERDVLALRKVGFSFSLYDDE